jgi:hypothetical protein
MPRPPRAALRFVLPPVCALLFFATGGPVHAQEAPPAYLSLVEGVVTLEREGESEPAVRDMPFVPGDRLRTGNGRAEIQFPDGAAIEIGEDSLVEAVTPSRVRLLAGTMDHIQGRAADAGATTSAAYLPPDLQNYGDTFDRDGSWQYSEPHGYVWYPNVAADWRPYYYGSWSAVPSYGWTWIGIDRWSWPTHHYGRWGYARNSWFWIPGRTWGAAWVSWAAAPDYVSWCPLGFDGRPVFGFSAAGSDPRWRHGAGGYRGWNGWTVMSRGHFGARGAYAHRNAIEPRQLPENTPFSVQSRPPVELPHNARRANATVPGATAAASVPRVYGRSQSDARLPHNGQRPVQIQRPAADQPATNVERAFGSPRRAYPIQAPRSGEAPRVTPAQPRLYPHSAVRPAQPVAPEYRPTPSGAGVPAVGYRRTEPQRPKRPQTAMPRYSAPPPPAQRAPAAPRAAATAPPPAPAAPPPARATPHARSAPAGAAQAGTARRR